MAHTESVELLPNGGWDERILICRNGKLVNVFIVVTQRYVIIVDTLINATTAQTLLDYAQPYLSHRQLLVVNTHADYDHAWGNQLFAGPDAAHPAPILAHSLCAAQFDASDAAPYLAQRQADEPAVFGQVVLTKPTLYFDHALTIDGGDLTVQLFPTPGHTPDHIAIYLPEIRTLLAADAAEIPFPFARSVEGLPQMRASLAALAAFDARTVFYCHAPPDSGPPLLHDNLAYFNALESACRAALAQNPDLDPAQVADLAAAVGCAYEDVTPHGGAWDEVHPYIRGEGHAQQLGMMLAWLRGSADKQADAQD